MMRKYCKHILVSAGALWALTAFWSCGQDRWPEYYPLTGRDLWIDSLMREEYLWCEEMPTFNELNYFLSPNKFIEAVRSDKDKGFSKTDSVHPQPVTSYGFSYSLSRVPKSDSTYYAMITDVLPQSPAADAGLQRGEWILKIDQDSITKKKENWLKEGEERQLAIGQYVVHKFQGQNNKDSLVAEIVEKRAVELSAARAITEQHAPLAAFLQNNQTAYLLYPQFEAQWDAELLSFSQTCQQKGVKEVVIDLRFAKKGNLSSALKLATLLVPASKIGQRLAYLEYNAKKTEKNRDLMLDASLIEGGQNLNLKRVFILTSHQTAGLAEMVINGLKSHMPVILIGENTKGEYVLTESFSNPKYQWTVSPAVCYAFNDQGVNDYSAGFVPNKEVNPLKNPEQVMPYGQPEEALLSVALGMIDGSIEIPQEQPKL